MANNLNEKLDQQAKALGELQVSVARVQQTIEHFSQMQQEVHDALQSIATNSKDLSVLHEKVVRLQEEQDRLREAVHGKHGVYDQLDGMGQRIRAVELWINGVKYVISPTVLAVFVEHVLRSWVL